MGYALAAGVLWVKIVFSFFYKIPPVPPAQTPLSGETPEAAGGARSIPRSSRGQLDQAGGPFPCSRGPSQAPPALPAPPGNPRPPGERPQGNYVGAGVLARGRFAAPRAPTLPDRRTGAARLPPNSPTRTPPHSANIGVTDPYRAGPVPGSELLVGPRHAKIGVMGGSMPCIRGSP